MAKLQSVLRVVVPATLTILAACGGASSGQAKNQAAFPTLAVPGASRVVPGRAIPNAGLENTLWRLVSLDGKPVRANTNIREARLLLVPDIRKIRGDTGCNNRMTGPYTLAGDRLRIGPVATTRIPCRDGDVGQEQAYLKALQIAVGFRVQGNSMELLGPSGEALAGFEALYLR